MFESEEQPELEQSNVSDQMQRFNRLGNLTKRSVTAIGVLTSNGKPDSFFTATDVAEKIIEASKLGEFADEDFFIISNKVNACINQAFKIGSNNLMRCSKKILPVICKRKNAKTSFGFRIGLPSMKTKEELHEGYNLLKNPPIYSEINTIKDITDIPFLLKLQTDISARIEELYGNMKNENYQLRDKISKFKRVMKDLEE